MQPFVSIIVPVYNAEAHLHRCIGSLLSQSYSNYEILLIDDGSTDQSGNICDEYGGNHSHVRVFHKGNGGVSSARNLGIEQSGGEWIQFVDSDDFVEKHYTSDMVAALDEGIDLVVDGMNQLKLEPPDSLSLMKQLTSTKTGTYGRADYRSVIAEMIHTSYLNYCYAKLFRKELLLRNRIWFDEHVSLGEDTLFILRVLRHANAIRINANTNYNYVIHSEQSLTYKFRENKFELLNRLHKELEAFCSDCGLLDDELRQLLEKRYMDMVLFCINENFKRRAHEILIQLERISKLIGHADVRRFLAGGTKVLNLYPRPLINAMRSGNAVRYFVVYYLGVLSGKFRGRL